MWEINRKKHDITIYSLMRSSEIISLDDVLILYNVQLTSHLESFNCDKKILLLWNHNAEEQAGLCFFAERNLLPSVAKSEHRR